MIIIKQVISAALLVIGFLLAFEIANADEPAVPEPFRGSDSSSTKIINYHVLTQWLRYLVVNTGYSDRRSAYSGRGQISSSTGTRIGPKVNKRTIFEANRFFFEGFENNQKARQTLTALRNSIEQIPDHTPLEYFNRDEQLAYWLNLYNITILNEVVGIYPTRDLEDLLVGEKSILSKKLLTVAGIPLSLNDIQYTILKENYGDNPLIMYGLYQGIIGGPNIRKKAYTGATVYRALEYNATEFINSNRGTSRYKGNPKEQKVSSLYARNNVYFPDFNADLSAHLLKYIEGAGQKQSLKEANVTLKPVINDWTVTDLWGTFPEVRNGFAENPAALLGAIVATTPGASGTGGASSANLAEASLAGGNYRHGMLQYLFVINMKRVSTNEKNATVTMEELGEFPVILEADERNKDSLSHWQRLAEKGSANAQYNLGAMYDSGDAVPEDDAEAARWYQQAADQGHVNAQYNLGVMYANGEGVTKNAAEAATWYRKAADQGNYRAQYNLGALYANGDGVPQSYSESYVWWNIAVMSGNKHLKKNRDRAAETLTPEELDLAQQRAAKLFEEIQQKKLVKAGKSGR